ncbi:2798_t:CDS:2, partial [Dentiscutata heterogama]
MLPVAPHMHSNYGGFHPHFGPAGGYPSHAIRYHQEVFSPTTLLVPLRFTDQIFREYP